MTKPYYQDDSIVIYNADCLDVLPEICGISAVVTDPPYNLTSIVKRFGKEDSAPAQYGKDGSFQRLSKGFMGKEWDGTGISFQPDTWRLIREACLPGAMLLSFGGTRTWHRIACAIEDAGFEIRDCIAWVYGSGFPKSLNIGKAVDKKLGNKREVVGIQMLGGNAAQSTKEKGGTYASNTNAVGVKPIEVKLTKGTSEWEGYGTGLKPAYEPIVLAMNPLDGTFAENCLKWGVGGLNIDGCRILHNEPEKHTVRIAKRKGIALQLNTGKSASWQEGIMASANPQGRFPANFIHDGSQEVMELFPTSSVTGKRKNPLKGYHQPEGGEWFGRHNHNGDEYTDTGSAARFFYCAKSSRSERNIGLDRTQIILYNMPNGKEDILCKGNSLIKGVKLVQLLVDTDTSPIKVIVEYGTQNKGVLEWSIELFGKDLTAKYQKDLRYIISTATPLTMPLQIYNWLIFLLTKEYTADVNIEQTDGGNLAGSAGNSKELIITISGEMASRLGVSNAVSPIRLKISVEGERSGHPTVKPLSLMTYLIKLVKMPEYNLILDPFMGSGSTLIAANQLGSKAIGIELDEKYCELALARYDYWKAKEKNGS